MRCSSKLRKKYTNTGDYTTNTLGGISTATNMSYPVFKPLTYVYNNITISDSYTLSRGIQGATNFYGLNNIDSHMAKNSSTGNITGIYNLNGCIWKRTSGLVTIKIYYNIFYIIVYLYFISNWIIKFYPLL